MNKVILVGNLTKDPEARTTPSGVACTTFTVACQRRFANQQGVREADFINCVAWRQTAEFISRYFTKGRKIGIEGSIQTRTYDAQDGTRRYVTEVVVDNAEFVDSNPGSRPREDSFAGQTPPPPAPFGGEGQGAAGGGFTAVEDDDDDLPF